MPTRGQSSSPIVSSFVDNFLCHSLGLSRKPWPIRCPAVPSIRAQGKPPNAASGLMVSPPDQLVASCWVIARRCQLIGNSADPGLWSVDHDTGLLCIWHSEKSLWVEARSVRKKTQRPNPVEEREEAVPNIADSKHQAKKIERTLKPPVRGRDILWWWVLQKNLSYQSWHKSKGLNGHGDWTTTCF